MSEQFSASEMAELESDFIGEQLELGQDRMESLQQEAIDNAEIEDAFNNEQNWLMSRGGIAMFIFEDVIYPTLVQAQEAAIEAHPELLDDDMPDFFDDNIYELERPEI